MFNRYILTAELYFYVLIISLILLLKNSVSPVGNKYRNTADSHSSHGSDDGRGWFISFIDL